MTGTSTAPAMGYSVVANFPGDRQITMQCFVAEDESDASVHKKLDRAFRFIDRQRTRYEIPELKEQIDKQQATLDQLHRDLAKADEEFDKAMAELQVAVETTQAEKDNVFHAGYAAHNAVGRQGAYTPRGSDASKIANADALLKGYAEQMEKNKAERNQFRDNILVGITRYENAIAADKAKLAEKEELLASDG